MKRTASSTINPPARSASSPAAVGATWCAHPAREQPSRAVVGVVWIAAVAMVLYATTINIFWPVFAVLFLLGVLSRFYFPSRYTIDDEGISASLLLRNQRMAWSDVRRFVHDERGGLLSDRAERSRLNAYRGMHVLFGDRADAADLIRAHLPGDCRVNRLSEESSTASSAHHVQPRASRSGGVD